MDGLTQGFKNVVSEIATGITKVISAILSIPQKIIDLLSDLLKSLFVPPDDYFTNKVNSIKEHFSFVDKFIVVFKSFETFFKERDFTTAPKISVNLSSAEGNYNYGVSSVAVDLSWYDRYKPSVDIILGSIIWAVFLWNTFRDLPNIIRGVGGAHIVNTSSEDDGLSPGERQGRFSRF